MFFVFNPSVGKKDSLAITFPSFDITNWCSSSDDISKEYSCPSVTEDCDSSNISWDGSDQAYKEFINEIDQAAQIIHGKLGVIKKPS